MTSFFLRPSRPSLQAQLPGVLQHSTTAGRATDSHSEISSLAGILRRVNNIGMLLRAARGLAARYQADMAARVGQIRGMRLPGLMRRHRIFILLRKFELRAKISGRTAYGGIVDFDHGASNPSSMARGWVLFSAVQAAASDLDGRID